MELYFKKVFLKINICVIKHISKLNKVKNLKSRNV